MLKLSRVDPHEWRFVYPDIYKQLREQFDTGCEFYRELDLDEAERVFRAVLAQMPDHVDAIHHLALVLSKQGLLSDAHALWEQSVRIGRKAFPRDFQVGRDRLEWGWLENRPFLRCLHGLALDIYDGEETEEALELFQELLSLNPNDNQGVRAMAEEALFELGRFADALEITKQYPDDAMAETLYGRALALFKLGRRREATRALKRAIEYLPRVGKELLTTRHRLPRTVWEGMITVGGADEAYEYWERWKQFWKGEPEALEWLRKVMERVTKSGRGKSRQ